MNDNLIILRVIAAAIDEDAAKAMRDTIEATLARYGSMTRADTPKRYWKNREWFEFLFELRPSLPASQAFDAILNELGSGWTAHWFTTGGNWAVWNAGPEARFLCPQVHWANLESE